MLLPFVATNSKTSNTLHLKNQNNINVAKLYCASKVRGTKSQMKVVGYPLRSKDTCSTTARIKTNGATVDSKPNDQHDKNVNLNQSFGNLRIINSIASNSSQDHLTKAKNFVPEKFIESDHKKRPSNNQDYKSRNATTNIASRYQQSTQRENHLSSTNQQSSRNDANAFGLARKTLEQSNVSKMAPINFPPLRAPQSIVNVRHPFVTEARTKHESGISKSKSGIVKDVDSVRQSYQGYGTPISGLPSVQNMGSIAANLSPYPRPDSFAQSTVTNVLFPETAQFSQSSSFNTSQMNQFQSFDPGSFATSPVNINQVISQFSSENSIPYPQYESQFVTPNHYSTDITSNQYQYPASVNQIQDSPLFIQSLHSPIAVTDQYAAPNYARAVRTELIPRLRRPPPFNN